MSEYPEIAARETAGREQKSQPQPDPRVGLNPTGRPRRSSAPSRRKQARRQERGEGS